MIGHLAGILDNVADRLETLGMIREAEEIDAISNALESAEITHSPLIVSPARHMPETIQRTISIKDDIHPLAFEIVDRHREKIQSHLVAIKVTLKAINDTINRMFDEGAERKPNIAKQVNDQKKKTEERLSELSSFIVEKIREEFLNFYHTVGGKEELSRYSIDPLRLASKKMVDKQTF